MTVRLKSGRTFTAEPDAGSNEKELHLRFDRDGLVMVRPVQWSSIVELRHGDNPTAVEAFRATIAKQTPKATMRKPESTAMVAPTNRLTTKPAGTFQTWRVTRSDAAANPATFPVRSIQVNAYLANWDADVEADGLMVFVQAFDATGTAVPVSGVLQAELVGERYPPLSRGNAFPVLGCWTQQVNPADFEASGIVRAQLEFQALHPDYQLWLSRFALVHVRLLVPGQGTFEASVDAVALRGFTPVRERLQQAFGTRFLPTETTGRGHRESSAFTP